MMELNIPTTKTSPLYFLNGKITTNISWAKLAINAHRWA